MSVRVTSVPQLRKIIKEDPRAAALFRGDNARVCRNASVVRILNAVSGRVREIASCAESWEENLRFVKTLARDDDWVSHVVRLEISTLLGERALVSGDADYRDKSFAVAGPVYRSLKGATPTSLVAFANNLAVMKELGRVMRQRL
jgi:hypothetical protein